MQINELSFGNIKIDRISYSEDIVIEECKIIERDKSASRKIKGQFGHTPLSLAENIPWNCKRLVIGSGMYGSLPVMKEVHDKAKEERGYLILVTGCWMEDSPKGSLCEKMQDAGCLPAALHLAQTGSGAKIPPLQE